MRKPRVLRSIFLFLPVIALPVLAQLPPAPLLTPEEIERLRAVKAWDIEFTYSFNDTRAGSDNLPAGPGYYCISPALAADQFNFSFNNQIQYTYQLTVAGKTRQSDCSLGSDSCLAKYQYPAAISGIQEIYNRYAWVHISHGCIQPEGGTGPGFQSLQVNYSASGDLSLDGSDSRHSARGRFVIDYGSNPPTVTAYFGTLGLEYQHTTDYEGCYRSDNMEFVQTMSTLFVDINEYGVGSEPTSDTQVRIENGEFVIRGSSSSDYFYHPCPDLVSPCNNIAVQNGGRMITTYEWVVREHPETTINVTRPSAGMIFVSEETDTIRWVTSRTDSLRVLYSVDSGMTYTEIADSIPASARMYVWKDIPEELSRKCRIRIESMNDTSSYGLSAVYRMKGYVLTRIDANGDYEAFTPSTHGWFDGNTANPWWPASWWQQFNYNSGIDPNTNAPYPRSLFGTARGDSSSYFPDWPLFVRAFGYDTCYATMEPVGDSTDYRYSSFWTWGFLRREWHGSCVGLSVSSVAAFGNKPGFISRFSPKIENFTNLGSLYVNDNLRLVVNELMNIQHSQAVKASERLPFNRTPNEAWVDTLKKILLSDDRSNDVELGIYSSRGAHSMAPYKITRDSGLVSGSYYLIGVYDPNHPRDDAAAILLRPSDGFWRFPPSGPAPVFIEYGRGLKLTPVSLYLGNVDLEYPKTDAGSSPLADGGTGPGSTRVMTTMSAEISIKSALGDSIGYSDSLTYSNIPGAEPLMLKTGGFHAPFGYELPDDTGTYNVTLSNFSTATPHFAVVQDSRILDYERSGAQSTETDQFAIGNHSLTVSNPDTTVKNVNLSAISISPGEDRVTRLLEYGLSPGGSSAVTSMDGGHVRIKHNGTAASYVLELIHSVEDEGGTSFRSNALSIDANSTHEITAHWDDLSQAAMVRIDNGSDETFEDSLLVNNVLGIIDRAQPAPAEFSLKQNYPNPFNASTTLTYDIPTSGHVRITIHNILGQQVASLVDAVKYPGSHRVTWDAKSFSSGIYYVQAAMGSIVATRTLLLLR